MTEIDAVTLPAPLPELDALAPVSALARLVRPGVPRWAYALLAGDLLGPLRSARRLAPEVLERGLPALPERPRRVLAGQRTSKFGTEPVYEDHPTDRLPAQAAVPPLRRLVDLAGTEQALTALVEILDALAAQQPGERPDCPEEMVCTAWPTMRAVLGEVPPPLRWEPPARKGRPELAALRPREAERHPRLAGVPRMGPPTLARGGLGAADARLTALGVLLVYVRPEEAAREDVAALTGWLVGPDRALPSAALRDRDRAEWAAPGVREAEAALTAADPAAMADHLLSGGRVGSAS